jgi:hypothetical protein
LLLGGQNSAATVATTSVTPSTSQADKDWILKYASELSDDASSEEEMQEASFVRADSHQKTSSSQQNMCRYEYEELLTQLAGVIESGHALHSSQAKLITQQLTKLEKRTDFVLALLAKRSTLESVAIQRQRDLQQASRVEQSKMQQDEASVCSILQEQDDSAPEGDMFNLFDEANHVASVVQAATQTMPASVKLDLSDVDSWNGANAIDLLNEWARKNVASNAGTICNI